MATRVNVNGTVKSTKPRTASKAPDNLHRDCNHYIFGAITLSVLLNGWAGWEHGPSQWFPRVIATAVMGVIPLGLLKASQVYGKLSRRPKSEAWRAKTVGMVGLFGLALSLIHVAEMIGRMSGAAYWYDYILPALLAVFIDGLLVVMEWVKTTTKD